MPPSLLPAAVSNRVCTVRGRQLRTRIPIKQHRETPIQVETHENESELVPTLYWRMAKNGRMPSGMNNRPSPVFAFFSPVEFFVRMQLSVLEKACETALSTAIADLRRALSNGGGATSDSVSASVARLKETARTALVEATSDYQRDCAAAMMKLGTGTMY